jgi:hypothetical protein
MKKLGEFLLGAAVTLLFGLVFAYALWGTLVGF